VLIQALQLGHERWRELTLAAGEVCEKLASVSVVLADVVVVDRLFDETPVADERVDGCDGGVCRAEERFAVDRAHDPPVRLDDRVWSNHLQIEGESAGPDRLHGVAQDVHDVLRIDASERPGEDGEVERVRFDLERLPRGDAVGNAIGQLGWHRATSARDDVCVWVDGEHVHRVACDRDCQSAVAAAKLEHPLAAEVAQAPERGQVSPLGIEDWVHCELVTVVGLYAFRVVPRAPNLCALRRVSSNFERE
jgi:hypothetical protein